MPSEQYILDTLREVVGEEDYRKMVDSMGGETQLLSYIKSLPGGREGQIQKSEPLTFKDLLRSLWYGFLVLYLIYQLICFIISLFK